MKSVKLFLVLALLIGACLAWIPGGPKAVVGQGAPAYGDPLPGLSSDDMALFQEGKKSFEEVEKIEDGLGPIFNARSCAECHSFPKSGGGSAMMVVRFGQSIDGVFNGMESQGGSLLQLFAIDPKCQEVMPAGANVVAFRQTTPLYGAGLIEAIPDMQLFMNAQDQQTKYPDQAGRIHLVTSVSDRQQHVGRFGWKAQQALLLDFSADAYVNEMGITSDLFPNENAPNGNANLLAQCDKVADPEDKRKPETGRRDIDNIANFMRLLAPPARGPITKEVLDGEGVFQRIGCAVCHTSSFTAYSNNPAIHGQAVAVYSDFLLHDVGTGDGIEQGHAAGTEFRTPPLWGLRASAPYLHDGSAATPEQAIQRHARQGGAARDNFNKLSPLDRQVLLAFLNSL